MIDFCASKCNPLPFALTRIDFFSKGGTMMVVAMMTICLSLNRLVSNLNSHHKEERENERGFFFFDINCHFFLIDSHVKMEKS